MMAMMATRKEIEAGEDDFPWGSPGVRQDLPLGFRLGGLQGEDLLLDRRQEGLRAEILLWDSL
jgi:hypothetical protein